MKKLIILLMLLISVNAIGQITTASYTNKGATVPFINSSLFKLNGVDLSNKLYYQKSIDTLNKNLSTGIVKITTGTGKLSIITDNSTNWNTAYGWGNHTGLYKSISDSINLSGFATNYKLSLIKQPTSTNTLYGLQSGNAITSGTNNSFIGYRSGYSITSGLQNTFIGHFSGNSSTANQRCVFLGYEAGYGSRATDNIFIGASSGKGARYGNYNTALGTDAGYSVYDGNSNIFIGYQAGFNESGSNKLYIENSNADSTNALIFGNFATNKLTINGKIKSTSYIEQQGIYAGIYVADASTAQSIANGTTYTKSTAFTTNGSAANCTADAANDKITITKTGKYMVLGTFSFTSGTNSVVWRGCAFLNGVEQSNIHWARKVGTGSDVGSASFMGIINVTNVPVDLDVRFRQDQAGAVNITIVYSNFTVNYIGE